VNLTIQYDITLYSESGEQSHVVRIDSTMSSADEADDEREGPASVPVTAWAEPKPLKFTLFVALPNEEVCTLRDLTSGISVFDVRVNGLTNQSY